MAIVGTHTYTHSVTHTIGTDRGGGFLRLAAIVCGPINQSIRKFLLILFPRLFLLLGESESASDRASERTNDRVRISNDRLLT